MGLNVYEYDDNTPPIHMALHTEYGVVGHIVDAASVLFEAVHCSPILFVGVEGHLEAAILDHLHALGLVQVRLQPLHLPTAALVRRLQQLDLADVLPAPHDLLLVLGLLQSSLVHLLAQHTRNAVAVVRHGPAPQMLVDDLVGELVGTTMMLCEDTSGIWTPASA